MIEFEIYDSEIIECAGDTFRRCVLLECELVGTYAEFYDCTFQGNPACNSRLSQGIKLVDCLVYGEERR